MAKLTKVPETPINGESSEWGYFFTLLSDTTNTIRSSGVTADRPTKGLWIGYPFFDTTLGTPIWYDGTNWIDSAGLTV